MQLKVSTEKAQLVKTSKLPDGVTPFTVRTDDNGQPIFHEMNKARIYGVHDVPKSKKSQGWDCTWFSYPPMNESDPTQPHVLEHDGVSYNLYEPWVMHSGLTPQDDITRDGKEIPVSGMYRGQNGYSGVREVAVQVWLHLPTNDEGMVTGPSNTVPTVLIMSPAQWSGLQAGVASGKKVPSRTYDDVTDWEGNPITLSLVEVGQWENRVMFLTKTPPEGGARNTSYKFTDSHSLPTSVAKELKWSTAQDAFDNWLGLNDYWRQALETESVQAMAEHDMITHVYAMIAQRYMNRIWNMTGSDNKWDGESDAEKCIVFYEWMRDNTHDPSLFADASDTGVKTVKVTANSAADKEGDSDEDAPF